MPEKRDKTRYRKRLRVRFGPETTADKLAYTADVSEEGLFIKTVVAKFTHGRLTVEVMTPEEEIVTLEGSVQWAKRVPPAVLHKIDKAGLGLKITRFLSGEEAFRRMVEAAKPKAGSSDK